MRVDIRHGKEDTGRKEAVVDRVEIDFGEGTGWTDVTKDVNIEYLYDNLGVLTFLEAQNVYSEPGVYTIRCRATYWDGEVVYEYGTIFTVLPPEGARFVLLKRDYYWGGTTSFRIQVRVYIQGGEMDETDEEAWAEKIEVNFDEGTGWHDFTELLHQYYRGERTLDELPTYTIAEPGTYTIRCRATYWDGEVVYSDPAFETTFTVG